VRYLLILFLLLPGCITTNQLEAERAYYQMQTAVIQQHEAQPLWEMKSQDPSKPIVLENVAYIRVFQPSTQQQNRPAQYQQTNYVAPWVGLLGNALSVAIPVWGAVKIVDTLAKNAGDTFNLNAQGDHNALAFERDATVHTQGDVWLKNDLTHPPTVVDPVVVNPVIVDPVVVRPEIVDPVIVKD